MAWRALALATALACSDLAAGRPAVADPPARGEPAGPGRAPLVALSGRTMGTGWEVLVRVGPGLPRAVSLEREIESILARIDARMSTWRDDSELVRFNAASTATWWPVSRETARVVAAALDASRRTAGAFDPTIGPLVALWGFGRVPALRLPPDAEALARARARVGHGGLEVRDAPPALRKRDPALTVDLSAIAKGYAVDALAEALAQHGARHFLVDIGGELRGRGAHPSGRPWRVAIEGPAGGERPEAWAVVELADAAIATSGDYRRFDTLDGERLPHVLDPRTGEPVHHGLASASVVAETAMEADALATALMVLGPRAGLRMARERGWAVLSIERRGDGWIEHTTPAFDRLDRIDGGGRPASERATGAGADPVAGLDPGPEGGRTR